MNSILVNPPILTHGKGCWILMLICFSPFYLKAQDKIHKTDGSIIEAKVFEINDSDIKYKKFTNQNGPSYVVEKSKVVMIIYENGEKDVFDQSRVNQSVNSTITKPVTGAPIKVDVKQQKPKTPVTSKKTEKGTINIFSEIKGIDVYLDEELIGTDIVTIDSVSTGSHYLKAIKEMVIVYGELITVNANTVTDILVKDTKEVQEKLLASKFKEQEEFKSKRLDVMLDTKYITETTGKTNSLYFPGYYSALGVSKTNSVSVTSSLTDWFFTQGKTKIDEYQFAKLTENRNMMDEIAKFDKSSLLWNNVGAGVAITGLVCGTGGAIGLASKKTFITDNHKIHTGFLVSGICGFLIGVGIANASNALHGHYISFEEGVIQVKLFNQKLKKSLGLPEYYDQ